MFATIDRGVGGIYGLGEPQVASVLLQPVLSAKLDQQSRSALVNRFGTARFLQLARLEQQSDGAADFSGARLLYADLDRIHASGASFRGADLTGVRLSSADLTGADLTGADLSRAHLRRTNLSDSPARSRLLSTIARSAPKRLASARALTTPPTSGDTIMTLFRSRK